MENIAQHTQQGIDFCDRLGSFLKERCTIENEYAAKLKYVSLVESLCLLHMLISLARLEMQNFSGFWEMSFSNCENLRAGEYSNMASHALKLMTLSVKSRGASKWLHGWQYLVLIAHEERGIPSPTS